MTPYRAGPTSAVRTRAIERVLSQQNVSTVMGTAQAGGIALAAARRDVDVSFHTPSEVNAAVTGNGRAGKAQVTGMVTKILALQAKPTLSDAADALALAICRCWRAPMIAGWRRRKRAPGTAVQLGPVAAREHNLARSAGPDRRAELTPQPDPFGPQ